MDMILGTAAGMVGGGINDMVAGALDPDNKGGVNWDALVAPVPEEMVSAYPGHELFAIPDHNQLVLHQKMEATEILSGLMASFTDIDMGIETPNTYAMRTRDEGTTLYIFKEDPDVAAAFCRDQCRMCMPYKFYATSMRTGQQVAVLESPCACPDWCCGFVCIPVLCIPVCCCMRTATWTMTPADGSPEKVLATMKKVPLCGPSNCCDRQMDIEIPESGVKFSMYRSNFPGKECCCNSSEMHFIDEQHPYEEPLGALWPKDWIHEYNPTNSRYPPLPEKGVMDMIGNIVKEMAKDIIGSDADTYLVEMPFDGIAERAGLMLGVIMYDMVYNETNGTYNSSDGGCEDCGPPPECCGAEEPVEAPPPPEE